MFCSPVVLFSSLMYGLFGASLFGANASLCSPGGGGEAPELTVILSPPMDFSLHEIGTFKKSAFVKMGRKFIFGNLG